MIDMEIDDAIHVLVRVAHKAAVNKDKKRLAEIRKAIDSLEAHYKRCLIDLEGKSFVGPSICPGRDNQGF